MVRTPHFQGDLVFGWGIKIPHVVWNVLHKIPYVAWSKKRKKSFFFFYLCVPCHRPPDTAVQMFEL